MDYKVEVHILDRGFLVESNVGRKDACNDGTELVNCLGRSRHLSRRIDHDCLSYL